MKTEEERKEYNRLKAQESRAKKKALGIPLNSPNKQREAQNRYNQNKKLKGYTNKLFSNVSIEVLELFDKNKGDMTDTQYFEYIVKNKN